METTPKRGTFGFGTAIHNSTTETTPERETFGTAIHNSTTETTPERGTLDFDFLMLLVYIILGFGCILVGAGCICCLRKLRTMLTYRQTIEQHSNNDAVECKRLSSVLDNR